MEKQKIYTIGYTLFNSKIGIDLVKMFSTLKEYKVSYLADVRSIPYSRQYPQCNSDNLKIAGDTYSVPYIHIPEVGAKVSSQQDVFSKASEIFFDDIFPIAASNRPERTELKSYEEIVDFRKFRNDDLFLQGIKRIENAYDKGYTLALMCSEKDPMNCHRFFLISRKLEELFGEWLEVEHIVEDKGEITTVTNKVLEKELTDVILKKKEVLNLNLFQQDMFTGESPINNYYGETKQEKEYDFCDRYWNLMHGWKKDSSNNYNKIEDYD